MNLVETGCGLDVPRPVCNEIQLARSGERSMMIEVEKILVMPIRKLISSVALLLCAFLAAAPASLFAQSAESDLRMVRSELVKISNIDDWVIGVFTAVDSISNLAFNWDWQCVYTSTGSFNVEVTSQNGGSRLTLESASGDEMNYFIYAYFRRGNRFSLTGHATPVINLNNLSGSQSLTCDDERFAQTNLWFAAAVTPADFNPAPPGIYRDFVTLMVSPE